MALLWFKSFMAEDGAGSSSGARHLSLVREDPDDSSEPQDDPDRALVALIRLGNESAFRTVWETYHARLADFANKYVRSSDIAADVVQHVFVALWYQRTALRPRSTLANYLYASVRHRAWNVIKHDRIVQHHAEMSAAAGMASVRNAGEITIECDELEAEAIRLLSSVPPRAREIFLMHREDGLTPGQIAGVLGLSPQTVYNQLARATRALAEGLEHWREQWR
jgi:RNA polymerase sigma-70 factor (ECF subfamily)